MMLARGRPQGNIAECAQTALFATPDALLTPARPTMAACAQALKHAQQITSIGRRRPGTLAGAGRKT
jgi:hypothetical protein